MTPFKIKITMTKSVRAVLLVGVLTYLSACGPQSTKPDSGQDITVSGMDVLTTSQRQNFKQSVSYLEKEQWSQAESILQALALEQPGVPALWLNLTLTQYQQDKVDQAGLSLNKVFNLTRTLPQAYNLAGLLAVKAGDFEDAKYQYKQALELQPDYANALFNMALLHDVYLQDIAVAVEYYQRYLELEKLDKDTRGWVEQLQSTLSR